MHLRDHEIIRKTYRHHYFPFVLEILKLLAASVPFYFILFVLEKSLTTAQFYIGFSFITLLFILVFLYVAFIYWADRLVITNHRVIHVNWKLLHVTEEHDAELKDIQDITIMDKGVLAFVPFLNYGTLTIETSASKLSVHFDLAPNPDAIKRFIFSVA